MANESNKNKNLFGTIVGVATIVALVIGIFQLLRNNKSAKEQNLTQSTMIAISSKQLEAQQTLVNLQQGSDSPTEIAKIEKTINALDIERLFIKETLIPGFIAQTKVLTIPTKTLVPTNTPEPTNTPLPTNTPFPTNTPVPTNTLLPPTPTLAIIFEDNFDNGIRPEWVVEVGEPIIKNGKLSSIENELSLKLENILPSDYSIEFDYYVGVYSSIVIMIGENFHYYMDYDNTVWYAFKENNWIEIARGNGVGRDENHLRFEVSGNKYMVYINANKEYEITYGEPITGAFQIQLNNDKSNIDNLQIIAK
jgi:hypothetical protein